MQTGRLETRQKILTRRIIKKNIETIKVGSVEELFLLLSATKTAGEIRALEIRIKNLIDAELEELAELDQQVHNAYCRLNESAMINQKPRWN